jgi:hypothetical protein
VVGRFGVRRLLSVFAIVTVGATLAASATAPASAATTAAKHYTLTVGITSASLQGSDVYWAMQTGIFAKLGLTVHMIHYGSLQSTNIAAGRLVTGATGPTSAFAQVEAGQATNMIYCVTNANDAVPFVKVGGAYNSLASLAGKAIGSSTPGGASYGAASEFSTYIGSHYGKPMTIVAYDNNAAEIAAVESGQIAAASQIYANVQPEIDAGLLRPVVSDTSATAKGILGGKICSIAFYGDDTALSNNKAAIVDFIAGLRVADLAIVKASNAQMAKVLATNPDWAPSVLSSTALTQAIGDARVTFIAGDDGYISKSLWDKSLANFQGWGLSLEGLNVNLHAPAFSYTSVVNMSYWNASTALIKRTKFSPSMTAGAKLP